MPNINHSFLDIYEKSLDKTKQLRSTFSANPLKKIMEYPLPYTIGKLSQKLFPSLRTTPVKNRLFWGDTFYAYGYNADYYLSGGLSDEGEIVFTKFLINTIKQQDVFVDIGANLGYFSLLAAQLTTAPIHAFEPTPETYRLLEKNTKGKNIKLNQVALGDSNGTIDFFVCNNPASGGINSLYKENISREPMHQIVVKKMTLDHYCTEYDVIPSLIKIDAEGAEGDIIQGALSCLKRYRPTVVMEVWPEPRQTNHQKAIRALMGLGYSLFSIDQNGNTHPIAAESLKTIRPGENFNLVLKA